MCTEKHVLVKKEKMTNRLNMGLPPQDWIKNTNGLYICHHKTESKIHMG